MVYTEQTTWVQVPKHAFCVKNICHDCPIKIENWIMPANLLVLNQMVGYNLVLGMDWLSKYNAKIDCKSRVVTSKEQG